jgi:hypothetical protein
MGHAILERGLLFGTQSADYITASGHSGRIVTEASLKAKTGRIHDRTRTLRSIVRFLLHRGHRPYMTHYGSRAARIVVMHKRFLLGKAKRVGIFENYAQEESRRAIKSARRDVTLTPSPRDGAVRAHWQVPQALAGELGNRVGDRRRDPLRESAREGGGIGWRPAGSAAASIALMRRSISPTT